MLETPKRPSYNEFGGGIRMSLHHFKHTIQTHRGLMHLLIFLKWLLLSGLAGLVAGFIACLF